MIGWFAWLDEHAATPLRRFIQRRGREAFEAIRRLGT